MLAAEKGWSPGELAMRTMVGPSVPPHTHLSLMSTECFSLFCTVLGTMRLDQNLDQDLRLSLEMPGLSAQEYFKGPFSTRLGV